MGASGRASAWALGARGCRRRPSHHLRRIRQRLRRPSITACSKVDTSSRHGTRCLVHLRPPVPRHRRHDALRDTIPQLRLGHHRHTLCARLGFRLHYLQATHPARIRLNPYPQRAQRLHQTPSLPGIAKLLLSRCQKCELKHSNFF